MIITMSVNADVGWFGARSSGGNCMPPPHGSVECDRVGDGGLGTVGRPAKKSTLYIGRRWLFAGGSPRIMIMSIIRAVLSFHTHTTT